MSTDRNPDADPASWEPLFRSVFEHALDAILITAPDGAIIAANPAACALFGRSEEELRLAGRDAVVDPEHPSFAAALEERARTGAFRGELTLQRGDGSLFPAELSSAFFHAADGSPRASMLIRDLTELRLTEQRYRTLVEQLPLVTYVHAAATRLAYVSPQIERLVGCKPEEWQDPRVFSELLHPDDRARVIAETNQWLETGEPAESEYRLIARDGRVVWIHDEGMLVRDARGRPLFGQGYLLDITQRKATEEALRASEERFRSLVDASVAWVWEADPGGRLVSSSPAVEKILGYRPEELLGTNGFELMHPDDRAGAEAQFTVCAREGRGWSGAVTRMRQKGGGYRYLESSGVPVFAASGELVGYRGADRDVTEKVEAEEERSRLEEELRQSQKMEAVGRLAGGVAHDFNNLLTAILGNSELALARLEGEHGRAELEEIRAAAVRAAALTRQLLAFSRKQILQPEQLDLNAVLLEMDEMLRRLLGEDIEFVIDLAPGLGRVDADRGQAQQVVLNLAVNARDAMPIGGTLRFETSNVTLGPAGRCVLLAVSDTGIGMSPETRERLFEPFFTTKEVGKGTGLGLSTVYGIVSQSGGWIDVHSAPGEGSRFEIYLPRVVEEDAGPSGQGLRAVGASSGETVLVVEDDDSVRRLVRTILEQQGYRVLVAEGPRAAIEYARSHGGPIHLVLTDVIMPEMSGPDAFELISALSPEVRVLYMSGYAGEALEHAGIEAGTAFIGKPFSAAELASAVRLAIGESRMQTGG